MCWIACAHNTKRGLDVRRHCMTYGIFEDIE